MYHCLDVIHQPLMLNLSRILHALLYLHWISVDLGSELSCDLDFDMSLSNVILHDEEHGFVALQQDLVLMSVKVLGRNCVPAHISGIDDTEGIL